LRTSELRHPFGVQDSTWAGWLTAVNAESGSVRWRYRSSTPLVAGITSTAARLVFTGDLLRDFMPFDARTGAVLWRYPTRQPIGGGVVTYRAADRQLVAVASGVHAPVTWKRESPPAGSWCSVFLESATRQSFTCGWFW
jgi:outer membrane protein assembly factor BamB